MESQGLLVCLTPSLRGHRAWVATHKMWEILWLYWNESFASFPEEGEFRWEISLKQFVSLTTTILQNVSEPDFKIPGSEKMSTPPGKHSQIFSIRINYSLLHFYRTLNIPLSWSFIESSLWHSLLSPCLPSPKTRRRVSWGSALGFVYNWHSINLSGVELNDP